ncbi:MAG: DUF2808 domain-containing protein [Cyanophyceae cyanobacterium]
MRTLISAIALSLAGTASGVSLVHAVQFADGTVAFEKSPRLVEARTTFKSAGAWGSEYYFTVELPEEAGEPLQTITFELRQGIDDIRFLLDETFAFVGTTDGDREPIAVQSATLDEATETIAVDFASPVPPGTTFTVALKPRRNPDLGGIYLFGVTAFPAGENPYGLYLGPGRLQFYRNNDRFFN